MAIYHLSTKPISRSSGRSAVASIAYRAGIKITDERLGKTYDYTKRSGVLWTGLATPNGLKIDRNELWNKAEKAETRSNSRTAREIVINIPHELMTGDQSAGKMLAYEFATILSQKYGIAVDVAVHAPDKQGDNRNYHAHLLLTTRQIEQQQDGRFELGKKSQLELSNSQLAKLNLPKAQDELVELRRAWAELANAHLAEHGLDERIDHRSNKDRGLETLPTVKMGVHATALERKGVKTEVGDKNRAIKEHNENLKRLRELERLQVYANFAKAFKTVTIDEANDEQDKLFGGSELGFIKVVPEHKKAFIKRFDEQQQKLAFAIHNHFANLLKKEQKKLEQIENNKPKKTLGIAYFGEAKKQYESWKKIKDKQTKHIDEFIKQYGMSINHDIYKYPSALKKQVAYMRQLLSNKELNTNYELAIKRFDVADKIRAELPFIDEQIAKERAELERIKKEQDRIEQQRKLERDLENEKMRLKQIQRMIAEKEALERETPAEKLAREARKSVTHLTARAVRSLRDEIQETRARKIDQLDNEATEMNWNLTSKNKNKRYCVIAGKRTKPLESPYYEYGHRDIRYEDDDTIELVEFELIPKQQWLAKKPTSASISSDDLTWQARLNGKVLISKETFNERETKDLSYIYHHGNSFFEQNVEDFIKDYREQMQMEQSVKEKQAQRVMAQTQAKALKNPQPKPRRDDDFDFGF